MDERDWDRSHKWEVHRFHHHQVRLTVVLGNASRAEELLAIRTVFSQFRDIPPRQIQQAIAENRLSIGVFRSTQAHLLRKMAAKLGLQLEVEDRSTVGFLAIDRTAGMLCKIEDKAESERIVNEMIAAGAEVIVTEMD